MIINSQSRTPATYEREHLFDADLEPLATETFMLMRNAATDGTSRDRSSGMEFAVGC